MQRTWIDRIKKIGLCILPIVFIALLIAFDQSTKVYIELLKEGEWNKTIVIDNFWEIVCTHNTGAAWSFLADKTWGQTFFKILTPIALVCFLAVLIYAMIKKYKILTISFILIIAGTIGNYIDRLRYGYVIDFLSFIFGPYNFPVFNMADSYMTIGIVLLVIHFLFLDSNALFKKNDKKEV